jgi:hypothetical protein
VRGKYDDAVGGNEMYLVILFYALNISQIIAPDFRDQESETRTSANQKTIPATTKNKQAKKTTKPRSKPRADRNSSILSG